MKTSLLPDHVPRPQPLNYHERCKKVLPPANNLLQFYLTDAEKFAKDNLMKINPKKTKVLTFNKSRKLDFPPELQFSDNQQLNVVSEMKLVGVILSDDIRWQKNTDYICLKARQKLWTLRRMKKLHFDMFQLLDVYTKEVRSLLELAVPVWHSSLTRLQSAQIERIQKSAFRIIIDRDYTTYEAACSVLGVEILEVRREKICLNFARKDLKSDRSIFTKINSIPDTRSKTPLVREFTCRTTRYEKSALPYLSRLLNRN